MHRSILRHAMSEPTLCNNCHWIHVGGPPLKCRNCGSPLGYPADEPRVADCGPSPLEAQANIMTKEDFEKAKAHNAAIYVLYNAIAIIESIPGGSEVNQERIHLWIKEMKEEAEACLCMQDRILGEKKEEENQ